MRTIQPSAKRIGRELPVPNLIELQLNSYKWFKEEGLPELFKIFSPIWDFTQTNYIEFADYTLGDPKHDIKECRDRDLTFEAPIKAIVRFGGKEREVIESEVYLGDLPLMTDKGTFIINGRERVIVSQLTRSPGLYFEEDVDTSMQMIVRARVIPMEGPWLEIENDSNNVVNTQISQTKKLPITQLIKALHGFERGRDRQETTLGQALHKKLVEAAVDPDTGEMILDKGSIITGRVLASLSEEHKEITVQIESPLGTNDEMIWALGKEISLRRLTQDEMDDLEHSRGTDEHRRHLTAIALNAANLQGKRPLDDVLEGSVAIVKAMERIGPDEARRIEELGLETMDFLSLGDHAEATLAADKTANTREAILDIYKRMRPGESAVEDAARALVFSLFFDLRRYDLGKVGRRFINKRLNLDVPLDIRNLTSDDLAATVREMEPYLNKEAEHDDIDDLRNKRVRSVGELLQSQLRLGFVRMEKVARERMTSAGEENLLPSIILSVKPVSASIKSFFSSNQLSTFMDQTNPLSELTNKRRLSSLGPGGLQRTSAKLEVRDVHRSHYGRICPIETPEGPNIGLISQLTTHARVDEFGFIMTPYRRIVNGVVQSEIVYLTAQEDFFYRIAPADTKVDENGLIVSEMLVVRCPGGDRDFNGANYPTVHRSRVDLMDLSPVQIISVATSLIPFLENDDANRALMGANMQRQAVPCLRSDRPVVGTGHEARAAVDSGAAIVAKRPGVVSLVTATEIRVTAEEDGAEDVYPLMHLFQSNKSTCFTQRPVIFPGDRVLTGSPLADGPNCDEGSLALGQNLIVAFMPWRGYNYEDAIVLSERLVKDDVFTSIHIERYETEAVDTKLGPEEITRDIPNVGEEALKDLDENGIIRIGAEVRPEDILVGKVAPKGQTEMTAEERLIIAIFGKKAEETRDVSLRLPHGEKGTVVDVKVFSRYKYLSPSINHIYKESKKRDRLICDRTEEPLLQIPGDELPAGTNMQVQVYVAQKRKIMVGDKMAGRHGNKGVISRINPIEDMPVMMDGTPVDIVLNPLGVPSRMNIGQILETHLGFAGRELGVRYHCPAFEGATEKEIMVEVQRMAESLRRRLLSGYLKSDLNLFIKFPVSAGLDEMFSILEERLRSLDQAELERISAHLAAPSSLTVDQILEAEAAPDDFEIESSGEPFAAADEVYQGIVAKVRNNVFRRAGIQPESCKSILRDGTNGEELQNPMTVGVIYMLKLEHLADEKIHARSIGPYSLVTQQPLGGKAQFGGQRFGEMEVWALEAYGAAYTLQELLTIKSDDVMGRVKAYESIVKGEAISEPGIPESFKILVNELRSLCLKVSVEDKANKELSLKDLDELTGGDDTRLARSVGFFN